MSDIVIRTAEEKDIKAMAALDIVCFSAPWSEKSFEYEINQNTRALYIVADDGGKILGYAGLWKILDEGHITNVAVAPEYRRKHIGKALMEVMADVASQNGINKLTLEVRESNAAAISLYEKMGFKEEGQRKGYYEDNGENAVIMWNNSI